MAISVQTKHVIAVCAVMLWTCAYPAMSRTLYESSVVAAHQDWMTQFERAYTDDAEKEKRFKIFVENLEYIEKFNNAGNKSYTLGLNQFSDLTVEEFIASYTGLKINSSRPRSSPATRLSVTDVPTSLDWRVKGAVTDIKNQRRCAAAQIIGYEDVAENSEEQLLQAVTNQPVSVAVAVNENFQSHKKGVFEGPCGTDLNHAVVIVGYGTSEDGKKYWLIKNSWGERWGEQGYMKLLRDSGEPGGVCGVAMKASYPIM
ncbi:hypothetical protein VNO80_28779 [Phaseolus coccineus]|uniref:Cysteine proteinase n=1 Tax=Phaseolus coccineus TaxID=3886 RepID=A0AAN9LEU5_PHACN